MPPDHQTTSHRPEERAQSDTVLCCTSAMATYYHGCEDDNRHKHSIFRMNEDQWLCSTPPPHLPPTPNAKHAKTKPEIRNQKSQTETETDLRARTFSQKVIFQQKPKRQPPLSLRVVPSLSDRNMGHPRSATFSISSAVGAAQSMSPRLQLSRFHVYFHPRRAASHEQSGMMKMICSDKCQDFRFTILRCSARRGCSAQIFVGLVPFGLSEKCQNRAILTASTRTRTWTWTWTPG